MQFPVCSFNCRCVLVIADPLSQSCLFSLWCGVWSQKYFRSVIFYCQKSSAADCSPKEGSFHNGGLLNKYLRKRGNREPGEAMLQANNLIPSKGASEASWAIPAFLSSFIGCGFQGCKSPWLNSFVCSFIWNILTVGMAECERLSSV